MGHVVRPGDSLSTIARACLGDGSRWPELARLNGIGPPFDILVGQVLRIPLGQSSGMAHPPLAGRPDRSGTPPHAVIPANYYLFILADEYNPLRRKVVRRVITSPRMAAWVAANHGREVEIFQNPERFGFQAKAPDAALSIGRHAQGLKPSSYTSASRLQPFGARRFVGRPFWIDEAKARTAGVKFHEADEIVTDLHNILTRTKDAKSAARIREVIKKVSADREVLLRGPVPASAIKGSLAMGATRGLQAFQVIGFAITAVDMKHAVDKSKATHSIRPISAEAVRQVGGWGMAAVGAKAGGALGVAFGIETGPGALAFGVVGMAIGGTAGYFGADWVADLIDEN